MPLNIITHHKSCFVFVTLTPATPQERDRRGHPAMVSYSQLGAWLARLVKRCLLEGKTGSGYAGVEGKLPSGGSVRFVVEGFESEAEPSSSGGLDILRRSETDGHLRIGRDLGRSRVDEKTRVGRALEDSKMNGQKVEIGI